MKKGDEVLYYHSGDEKAVVGLATVSKGPFPDPTDEKWTAVELRAGRKLKTPVTLTEIRAEPKLSEILLVRNSRISVIPLTRSEFDMIVKMSG
jgi:predicted RNA-binding protein with PUA-like domain